MVRYSPYSWSFHLQQGLFVTFDVYLSYLSDRSHFMAPLRAVTSVRLPENSFRSNQNNLILLYWCTWKQRSQHRVGRWFSIDLFYCRSNFVSGKWLCPSPEVRMVTVGNSARDFGSGGYLWTASESSIQVCEFSTAEALLSSPHTDIVLRWMLVKW